MTFLPRLCALFVLSFSLLPLTVTQAEESPEVEAEAPISDLPSDVAAFVSKREDCEHFSGEEPYDAERAAEITQALSESCPGLNEKWTELRARYKNDSTVMDALGDELPLPDGEQE